MKRMRTLFLLIFIFSMLLSQKGSALVTVEAFVQEDGRGGQPIEVKVLVTHPAKQVVDIGSFRYENYPVTAELKKNEPLGKEQIISIYAFSLPPKPAGFYWLSPVELSIQGKLYRSIRSSYTVGQEKEKKRAMAKTESKTSPNKEVEVKGSTLKLQAFVDSPMPLFPGQRARLIYKYLFSGNIELTEEHLPMLEAEGLQKIGDLETKELQRNKFSTLEVSQLVEAKEPGEYSYGPSYIEGYAYVSSSPNQKSYLQPKLRAEAAEVVVKVAALPEDGRSSIFQGAVGQFSISSRLLTAERAFVGDALGVEVVIWGKGEMSSVELPKLSCQPGFSGLFLPGDKPVVGTAQSELGRKVFVFELRPLSSEVKNIPPITFIYFNPQSKQYESAVSSPIPIAIQANSTPPLQIPSFATML